MWTKPEDQATIKRVRAALAIKGVLSLYLPIMPESSPRRGYAAEAMNLLRAEKNDGVSSAAFEREKQRVLDYVRNEYRPSGQTLAVFSSAPNDLFETLSLQVRLPGLSRFADGPYLAPIEAAIQDNPRILIAAIDERKARFIKTYLNQVESEKHIEDDVPARQRQGGWVTQNFDMDRAEHIRDHMRHVAEVLQKTYEDEPFKRIVVAGTPEAISVLMSQLPQNLQSMIAGTFQGEMFASEHELMEGGLRIAAEAERADELKLVDTIMEAAQAIVGWEPTLRALADGRVHELAIDTQCLGTDNADRALELAWDTAARVEYVRGTAAQKLSAGEGIAALLRY
jgi:peptide subunit release factor 1 (eRF1)